MDSPKIFVGSVAATIGAAAALRYHELGLTLSHYDARGHLIVARRIIDSITPGWQQIGAVWLPLPHVLNVLPVQIDAFYRSGASAVAMSVASFVVAAVAIARIVQLLTGSSAAAVAASAVFVFNPNVVYLQATPMTEPLLLALITWGVAETIAWADGNARTSASRAGVVLALACLTRYEAWPVTYAALAAAVWTRWRRNYALAGAVRSAAAIAVYPTAAILAFALFSRVVVGQWFVSSDFFVPENKAQGLPIVALDEIVWGARELSGYIVVALAIVGAAAMLAAGVFVRRRASAVIALSLAATAAVPWAAFIDGHPYRIRYMVPLMAIEAVAIGALVGVIPMIVRLKPDPTSGAVRLKPDPTSDIVRLKPDPTSSAVRLKPDPTFATDEITGVGSGFSRTSLTSFALAGVVIVIAAIELHPFDTKAPMVVEAQWDRVNVEPRRAVTQCLKRRYNGESIMASMGSLGHYMQETSHDGFNVRDFLHEGNGDIWLAALNTPRLYVGWLLIEEKAEGGDMLYKRARENHEFLRGFSRVCEGAGVALYERQNRMLNVKR